MSRRFRFSDLWKPISDEEYMNNVRKIVAYHDRWKTSAIAFWLIFSVAIAGMIGFASWVLAKIMQIGPGNNVQNIALGQFGLGLGLILGFTFGHLTHQTIT